MILWLNKNILYNARDTNMGYDPSGDLYRGHIMRWSTRQPWPPSGTKTEGIIKSRAFRCP